MCDVHGLRVSCRLLNPARDDLQPMSPTRVRRHERLVTGQSRGLWAAGARAGLRALAGLYGVGVGTRNRLFDAGLRRVHELPVPVISVGNLTVGGTGKTPLILWLTETLIGRGLRVAVLARGVGADRGQLNDELQLVARRCPQARCVADPDRVAAARRIIRDDRPDVILLDDGFQHRRLGRDLDIVTLDATCPFGHGHLLPRGWLRESPIGLRRAGVVVLTHADRVDDDARANLIDDLRAICGPLDILCARHRADGLVTLTGEAVPTALPAGCPVACFCSIARPDSFERTVRDLGYVPIETRAWPDHHRYEPDNIRDLAQWAKALPVEAVLTTEKDAAKLADHAVDWPCPIRAVRISIDFFSNGATILATKLDRTIHGEPNGSSSESS